MANILMLFGPNLNMLGMREPEVYGSDTMDDTETMCRAKAEALGHVLDFRQSNHEGDLVDWIQEVARGAFDGLIINAAAYTHTSVAIHDALKLLSAPIVEVHFSNPATREDFRHHSYVTPLAATVIKGEGAAGHVRAVQVLSDLF